MRITSKGQVTIPREIRETCGLLPGTEVEFVVRGRTAQIVKTGSNRGARAVNGLRGRATTKMSTAEIMSLTRG